MQDTSRGQPQQRPQVSSQKDRFLTQEVCREPNNGRLPIDIMRVGASTDGGSVCAGDPLQCVQSRERG